MKQKFHFVNVTGNSMYDIMETIIASKYTVHATQEHAAAAQHGNNTTRLNDADSNNLLIRQDSPCNTSSTTVLTPTWGCFLH
jgi:hypothetical protein